MADEIVARCKGIERGVQRIIVYTEFFGPSSFAGVHVQNEPKELRLFDVELYKRGLLPARQFVREFGDLSYAAQWVYDGNMNKEFIEDVRKGEYSVNEGVVAKGDGWMVKIKTLAYLRKLQEVYGTDYRLYWE
jgi:hypothetical protein